MFDITHPGLRGWGVEGGDMEGEGWKGEQDVPSAACHMGSLTLARPDTHRPPTDGTKQMYCAANCH